MDYEKACYLKKKRRKMSKKTKLRIVLAVFLAIILLLVFYYLKVICPIIVNLSQEKVRAIATSTISEVVGDVMMQDGVEYDKLVKVTFASENKVEMIEIDTVEVNILIRQVTELVQERFNSLGEEGISISLGTFTGIPFKSEFQSAGINQTLHRLNFIVNSNIGMVLPGMTQNFQTELEVLLCESIIVGDIPSVYLQGSII